MKQLFISKKDASTFLKIKISFRDDEIRKISRAYI